MSEQQGLLAGFAKIDVTPDYPVGLRGYANDETRISEMVVDNIYVTCIALTEGEETILMYTIDNCACEQPMADRIRACVTAATNIPGEKIFCAATHTHSAPSIGTLECGVRYRGEFLRACVKAAQDALADRAPAKVLAAKREIEGMNFVRHYVKQSGGIAGVAFGSFKGDPAVAHTTEPDKQLLLIKFQREGLHKSILLVNWQGHPDCSAEIGKLNIAASYPGPLRDALTAYTGDLVAYFTGDDGNTVIHSAMKSDNHDYNWREYGVKMAELAYDAYKDLQEVEGTGISTNRRVLELETDHGKDHMIDQALEVIKVWKEVGLPEGMELAKSYGMSSVYQANAIRNKYNMDKTRELEINAFRVGGIGFTGGSYEMFSEAGLAIREGSPYEYTFLLTGNFSYIPSERAYDYQCYEAVTGYFARGTGEYLADQYIDMLHEIK